MIKLPPAPNHQVTADSIKRDYLEKLRDEFAAKAMQTFLINKYNVYQLAADAYKVADAMLEARQNAQIPNN